MNEAPSTQPTDFSGEVNQLTEGGGTEGGALSEGPPTNKTVEPTPTVQQTPPTTTTTTSTNPPKKQPGKPKFKKVKGNNKKKK